MLQNLHVKNLALIDEIEVDFSKGLNILTGETGAGKSIILGSIGLALGGRYSADMLRKGAGYGLVELTFQVEHPVLAQKLEEKDIILEDGQLIISRKLMDGRSVCRINGETVTLSELKSVAGLLIDIHGQHEHQSLLYKKNHLQFLDAFSKTAREEKEVVKKAYKIYKELYKELEDASANESDRLKEMSFLEFETHEIESANLSEAEEEELEESYRRMAIGRRLSENLEEVYTYTSDGGTSAGELVSRGVRALSEIMNQDDKVSELYGQLVEIENLLGDFNHELQGFTNSLSFSPEEFYEVETRINEVNRLKSKYGNSVRAILEYYDEKKQRLLILSDYDSYMEDLRERLSKAEETLRGVSLRLRQIRQQEAKNLEKEIIEGLKDLNFLEVQFEIHFEETKDYTSEGMDDVEFLISMNPGESVKPLSDVASGGELSRIMLALKAVLADKDSVETLIFDEIDVGISGRTAQKVSEKMAVIGGRHQVICITHLAQIAAMADAHYEIAKHTTAGVTKTSIHLLNEEETICELARILGGVEITDAVLQNAKEMKFLADRLKK